MSVAEIYRIVKQAIVKVTTVGKSVDSGTGFIVSPLGYIVTCYHVIDKAEKIEITLNSLDISIDAQVIGYDTTTDIAILKADVKFDEFLPLGHSEDLKTGENVLMFGYPLVSGHRTEKEPTIFETTVSNATPAYFKLRGAAGIGASGGPIYSVEQEAVVGVIAKELTQITIDYEVHTTGNASFAVPIHRCRQLLQDLVSAYKQVSSKEYVDQFVNRVADIYRAQGFDIETDISLGAGEVLDLYATTQFGGTSLRLGISCLYQLDMVTAESIREKLPTFLLAKKLPSPIDKNIVISNSPFSIEAKEIASRSDIDLIGYQQLVSQTVNFQGYLREFVRSFQSLRFFDHLIDSPCSVTDEDYRGVIIASAFDHIRNVLTQEPNSCIALLGDFGIGKTTLGLQLTSFLAQKHLESPVHNRVPIHIDLKNHKTGARIEETIVQSMRVHYGIKWDMQAFSFLAVPLNQPCEAYSKHFDLRAKTNTVQGATTICVW